MAKAKDKPWGRRRSSTTDMMIAPMIDVVFLLLIYFIVSSTIQKQEADLRFSLPGVAPLSEPLEMPDEQTIRIADTGQAILNDFAYDEPSSKSYRALAATLSRFRQACEANGVEARVTIAPSDVASHASVVKVMDACALAKVESVRFALE